MARLTSPRERWPTSAIEERLAGSPLFRPMKPESRASLAASANVTALGAGDVLWHRGDRATSVGFVLVGRLKIVRPTDERDVVLDVAIPGDLLGEISFAMASATYEHDVVCMRTAHVARIPTAVLHRILLRNGAAALALASDLASNLLRLTRFAEDLVSVGVERRLARVLLRLADRAGEPFPGGTLIPLKLRRTDIATMAATTLESTSRKLRGWEKKGWLVPQPAGYLVRNREALRTLAREE